MKIAIIGAGAMGCMHGAYLSRAGAEICLVDTWAEHIKAINQNGLRLFDQGREEIFRIDAVTEARAVGPADLVLFFVKSFDTAAAARGAACLAGPETYAMTLQNGLGNVEAIMEVFGADRIIYGTTLLGGHILEPGCVEVDVPPDDRVMVRMGEWGNQIGPFLKKVADLTNQAGLKTEISENPGKIVWTKITLICIAGSLNALTRLRVGGLMSQEGGQELKRLIAAENVMVANKKGVELDLDELIAFVDSATTGAWEHITSMLKDVLSRRKTEIGSFNEAVALEAEKLGLSAPVNKTVGLLMRIVENTYDQQIFEV